MNNLINEIDFSKILIADSELALAEAVRTHLVQSCFISREKTFIAKEGIEIIQLLVRERIGNVLLSHMLLDYLGEEHLLAFLKKLDCENRKLVFWLNLDQDWRFAEIIIKANLQNKYPIFSKNGGIKNFSKTIWLEFPGIFHSTSCGI